MLKRIPRFFYVMWIVLIVGIVAAAFWNNNRQTHKGGGHRSSVQQPSANEVPSDDKPAPGKQEPPQPAPYTTSLKLLAVGDIMMHSPQIPAGYNAQTGTYSFDSFFEKVKDPLSAADITYGNLETPLGGKELGYSGYPQFNAPAELADALKNAGFDVLSTANNHSLDRRETGVLNTLKNLRARGLIPFGTAASPEEAEKIVMVNKNEMNIAFLAYTYGTNGIPLPQGKPYLVSLINEANMKRQIAEAREQKADIVVVAVHFGQEYQRMPNDYQKNLAKMLVGAGADLVLGSHPHVVQPYEWVEAAGADGTMRKGLVIYSLGNFISNQSGDYTDYGVMFEVSFVKHFPEQTIDFGPVQTSPTWVHRYVANGKRQYRVLPLESVVASKSDRTLTPADYSTISKGLQEMKRHLSSFALPVNQAAN